MANESEEQTTNRPYGPPTNVTSVLARLRSRNLPERIDAEYLRELNEAYQHFFFHYSATPLLVVETSQFDADTNDVALDDLVRQISGMTKGTRYYVPRTQG